MIFEQSNVNIDEAISYVEIVSASNYSGNLDAGRRSCASHEDDDLAWGILLNMLTKKYADRHTHKRQQSAHPKDKTYGAPFSAKDRLA